MSSWAACLSKVFEVEPLVCRVCSTELVPVAVIMNDSELVRLLRHLRLPTDFPKTVSARSRPPPDPFDGCGIDPRVERYEGIDALPDYDGPQG